MRRIEATFRIVTPMFLGDAEQHASGIRPPAIKGALRFWWRALNWKEAMEKSGRDENKAFQWLHRNEARLFGLAAKELEGKQIGGQGIFLLKASMPVCEKDVIGTSRLSSVSYLLGMGLWHYKQHLLREALKEDQTFSVHLMFSPKAKEEEIASILQAFKALCLLGAIGSRARRGFGSFVLESYTKHGLVFELPIQMDREGYAQEIKKLAGNPNGITSAPPFSSFSDLSRIDVSCSGNSGIEVLKIINNEMQLYRSYGRLVGGRREVNGKAAEQNFEDDHKYVLRFTLTKPPKRAVFGLPHNYHYSSGMNVEINPVIGNDKLRRASPLLIHVHKIGEDYFGIHVLFESVFLPDQTILKVEEVKNKRVIQSKTITPVTVDYQDIRNYLDRYENTTRILG